MNKLIVFIFSLLSLTLFSFEELKGIGDRECGVATKKGVTHPQFPTYKMNCETFAHIIGSWYKDKKNVYFYKDNNSMYVGFEVIDDINPEKVKPIGESSRIYYMSDEKKIYIQIGFYMEKEKENINIRTFKILENGYAMDNKKVYYLLTELENADVKTFKVLNKYYAKDKNYIYYYDKKVKDADPKTFRIIGERIRNKDGVIYDSEDKNNTYDMGERRPKTDFSTFEELGNGYSKDKKNVYYGEKYVEDADYLSFEILGDYCSKDKNYIYCYGKKIENVDSLSFEILDDQYSKDKNNVYYYGKKIENADSNTFKLYSDLYKERSINKGVLDDSRIYDSEDKNNFYFSGKIIKKK